MPSVRLNALSPAARAGVALSLGLALLLVLESVARVVSTVEDDVQAIWERDEEGPAALQPSPTLGWMRRPGFKAIAEETHMREFDGNGFQAIDTAQARDPSAFKLLFVGDSNTFGFDVPTDATFVEVAERLLPGALAINLGVPGYSSYQGLLVAREQVSTLHPRVVVVSFNFNDRRRARVPDSPEAFRDLFQETSDYWATRLASRLDHLYLFRGMRRLSRIGQPTSSVLNLEDAVPRVNEADYRANLLAIAEISMEFGATPVFMLLRDNPRMTAPLRDGLDRLQQGEPERALAYFENVDSELADLAALYSAAAYRALGRTEEAQEAVEIDSDLPIDGGGPIRLDTAYNDIMIDAARALDITLVDAASLLDAASGSFTDEVHFDVRGHRLVGELLATSLAPLLDRRYASGEVRRDR